MQDIEKTVFFSVPLVPQSVNHYKVPTVYRKGVTFIRSFRLTNEAKAFKAAVAVFNQGRTVAPATASERRKVRYEVKVDIYLGKGQRLDADNSGKLICDSLVDCGCIHSDAFVAPFIVTPHKDQRWNPHTEFQITRLEGK
jgi:hypothetical protein